MISLPATLSLYDLTSIQSYVFGSNRLAANLGASWLSRTALEAWLREAARKSGADVLWSGGGNAMVCSAGFDEARAVATHLSRRLLDDAPGLNVMCAHEIWVAGEAFTAANDRLQRDLRRRKQETLPAAVFGGAGVCERCVETGDPVPVASRDPTGAILAARLRASEHAEGALRTALGTLPSGLTWSRDVDRLGRSRGDRSIVGVVHFDGNRMGDRFQRAASDGIEKLVALSGQVERAGIEALQTALAPLLDPSRLDSLENDEEHGFQLFRDPAGSRVVPVRPIVYGGDDITLICDGRLAVDLGARLLQAWHEHSTILDGGAAHACVGVALADSHFPFFRAYELAERLCTGAKRWLQEQGAHSASALDWSLVAGGGAELTDPRRGDSTARPYVVGTLPAGLPAHRGWNWFRRELVDAWIDAGAAHSQIKGLGEALWADLQSGAATRHAVEHLLARWEQRGLQLPVPDGVTQTHGLIGRETPYLDAVELLDRVLPSSHPLWQ